MAAAIAGVGGSAIAAATGGGMHAMTGGMHGGAPPFFPTSPRRDDVVPGSLHGENVVADGHGGFQTLVSQTGRVTMISATSVTARSDDGFVGTYVVDGADGSAQPAFHVDDRVIIRATREAETTVVTSMRRPL